MSTHMSNPHESIAKQLPTKIIYCYRSNVPLASVTAICSQGWPMLSSIQTVLIHPIYQMPLAKLVIKLEEHLELAQDTEWSITDQEISEIKLCMSAIMYALDAIWQAPAESRQHIPSLPSTSVAVGSAARLAKLAAWFDYVTSKKISFPLYRISKHNDNINWENFAGWLDDAEAIKHDWEHGAGKLATEEELRKREAALLTVKAEHIYKRIDFNKVWGWIDIQMSQSASYPAGRRETFKSLFMKGDTVPEDWTTDDVDDLVEAILTTCDCGNEITHFINTRLKHIRQLIVDFYSSFTLLSSVSRDASGAATNPDAVHTEQEAEFFADFDKRANELTELPAAPKREHFTSLALFLRAQAQHNILMRRYDMKAKTQATQQTSESI